MKCEYCNNEHFYIFSYRKYNVYATKYTIACSKCNNILHEPPNYISYEQHKQYLEKYIENKL